MSEALLPVLDDPSAADPARAKLDRKKSVFSLLFRHRKRAKSKHSEPHFTTDAVNEPEEPPPQSESIDTIHISKFVSAGDPEPEFQWVALYENQRGLTIFSVPHFSHLTLLPFDPYPFTIPTASHSRSHQPNISLHEYPLPNGNWRWVSKTWMVDMRSGSGEVQHDGFEYNWIFRSKNWKPRIGPFSFVRRRRWVRLMMRPGACKHEHQEGEDGAHTPAAATSRIWHDYNPYRHRGSIVTIGTVTSADIPVHTPDFDGVWQGDVELDWFRYLVVMKHLATDGKKLETWKKWLNLESATFGPPPRRNGSEDEGPVSSEPQAEMAVSPSQGPAKINVKHIASVVNEYGDGILRCFIFPESRARLIELFASADVLPGFSLDKGQGWPSTLDFYSYINKLEPQW